MKVYIVNWIEDYESFEVSYHLTRKGALREIMRRQYEHWALCRYVSGYDEHFYSVSERDLNE